MSEKVYDFEFLSILLKSKNIAYNILDIGSLAPSLTFRYKKSNFRVSLELRDDLSCTIFENDLMQYQTPISKELSKDVKKYFGNVLV